MVGEDGHVLGGYDSLWLKVIGGNGGWSSLGEGITVLG